MKLTAGDIVALTQRWQDADYPIFLAEVASTFNEELLTHHLLEQTDDRQMRAYLISLDTTSGPVEDTSDRACVFREVMCLRTTSHSSPIAASTLNFPGPRAAR